MKTRQELNLEYWGRVVPMCKGTALENSPWRCVKMGVIKMGVNKFNGHPSFDSYKYELAVAVLEDRPVFIGDVVYDKNSGDIVGIKDLLDNNGQQLITIIRYGIGTENIFPRTLGRYLSWAKPEKKRTFKLNGVELPCPIEPDGPCNKLNVGGKMFSFDTKQDADKVKDAICRILEHARNG